MTPKKVHAQRKKSRRILITGGAGFIGSHLAERLLNEGNEVYVFDDLSTGSFDNILHLEGNKNFHYTIDTVLNKDAIGKYVDLADHIYHLAAAVGVRTIIERPMRSLETNIQGTENVLRAASLKRKKVFVASTSEVYGKNGLKGKFKEDDDRLQGPTHISRWGYAASKAIDEFVGFSYHREKKVPVVISRLFNVVGPRQTGRYGMVVPNFVRQALRGKPITIYGTGKQSRCFAYVGDVVDAMVRLMATPKAVGELFNIGTDEEISMNDLAARIKKMTKSKSPIVHVPYEKAYGQGYEDMVRRSPDLRKIRTYTGWRPKTKLSQTLERIIASMEHVE